MEKLKRALVVLIVSLARTYKCTVHVTRESSDEEEFEVKPPFR